MKSVEDSYIKPLYVWEISYLFPELPLATTGIPNSSASNIEQLIPSV
jgi:hypothetical protein